MLEAYVLPWEELFPFDWVWQFQVLVSAAVKLPIKQKNQDNKKVGKRG
jgi:hypothetical protein